jgi:hypothetical protein
MLFVNAINGAVVNGRNKVKTSASIEMGTPPRLALAQDHLLKDVMAPSPHPDDNLFAAVRSIGRDGAQVTLAAPLGLIEPPIEQAQYGIHSVRNDFVHSAADLSLAEPNHQKPLQRILPQAQASPLWPALAPLLLRQTTLFSEEGGFIQLVNNLVASIEACALL